MTEADRERARQVYEKLGVGPATDERTIAVALAVTRAEGVVAGMNRAAIMVEDHEPVIADWIRQAIKQPEPPK